MKKKAKKAVKGKAAAKGSGDKPKFGSPEWKAKYAKKGKSSKRDASGRRMID